MCPSKIPNDPSEDRIEDPFTLSICNFNCFYEYMRTIDFHSTFHIKRQQTSQEKITVENADTRMNEL